MEETKDEELKNEISISHLSTFKLALEPGEKCCCNCQNLIALHKHPVNSIHNNKGPISEPAGLYACIVHNSIEPALRMGIIFDQGHGECELHVPINF
jgi:hypothetical protein